MQTRPGYFAFVVWTPEGWRLVCGGWPSIAQLIVSDLSGNTLATKTLTDAGALNFLRGAASPEGVIAFTAQSLHNTMVVGTIQTDLTISYEDTGWPAYGQCGVNVADLNGGFVYYGMLDGYSYYEVIGGVRGDALRNPFQGGTSQGWIDVFGGNLRWIDQYRNDPAQQLLFPTSLNGVTLGQNAYNAAGDYVGGYSPSGERFMAANVLGQEPTLASNGSEWAWCARLLNGQVGFGLLPPFHAAPADSVTIPTFPPCQHVMSLGFAFEPHPVDWNEWCVIDHDDWPPAIDRAKARKVPIVADWDEEGEVFDFDVFAKFEAQCGPDLRVIPALRFYPLPGESTAQSVSRWEPFAQRMSAERPGNWGYVFCIYTQNGRLPLQQVINGVHAAYRLGLTYKARNIDGFAWNRADGVTGHPELQEVARRLYAAMPTARLYPRQPDAPPVPPDPKPPQPIPVSFEVFLMAIAAPMTLLRSSLFIPSKNAPGRYLYPAPGKSGFYLSLAQDQKGGITVSETQNDGGAEQFLWERDRGLATVGDSTNPIGGGYPVMNDGEPK